MQKPTTIQHLRLLAVSTIMGFVIGVMYLVFEEVANQGTYLIWTTLAQSDMYRRRVIPLAIILGIIYSFTILQLKKKRLVPVNTDLSTEIADQNEQTSIKEILIILGIGEMSLIAGASLGPEAALVAASIALATWFARSIHLSGKLESKLLVVTSLGALLCAFLHTLIPMIIPLLMLLKQKKLRFGSALIVIVCCLASWGVVYVVKGQTPAKYPLPTDFNLQSILLAAILGFLTVAVALGLKRLLTVLYVRAQHIDAKVSWAISAVVFGGLLGLLYYFGGESIQFSGEAGIKTMLENQAVYSVVIFVGLLVMKMIATSWSLASGYRGGMVFPSLFMATALSLAICTLFGLSGIAETGAIIGGSSGMLIALTSPIVGIVLVFSMFPLQLVLVMIGGATGAMVGNRLFKKLLPPSRTASD